MESSWTLRTSHTKIKKKRLGSLRPRPLIGSFRFDRGIICGQDAIQAYDKCLEIQPDSRNAGQNRLLALNYVHLGEDPMVCSEHRRWGDEFQSQFDELPAVGAGERAADKRLVVGYMSPDFFTHSVSYFAEAPLTHHSPDRLPPLPNLSPSQLSSPCLILQLCSTSDS